MKPRLIVALASILAFIFFACGQETDIASPATVGSTTSTAGSPDSATEAHLSSEGNICSREPKATPTPASLASPTPPPTPTPVPTRSATTRVPEPELPRIERSSPVDLPEGVRPWEEAVVHVEVRFHSGNSTGQTGLVIDESGLVMTVVDLRRGIESARVALPNGNVTPAEIVRVDPITQAVLLRVDAEGLTAAPSMTARVQPGEPVFLISRREAEKEPNVLESYASPSKNAPERLFALLSAYAPRQAFGTVVVNRAGTPIGLASEGRAWTGALFVSGPPGVDQSAVLLESALDLLNRSHPHSNTIPVGLAYHGQSRGTLIDSPVARERIAEPLRNLLSNVGESVELPGLGRESHRVVGSGPGTFLEVVLHEPQALRGPDGSVRGRGRYFAFWWDREQGQPDLVLCGPEPSRVGAAFRITSAGETLAPILEELPRTGRSVVIPERVPHEIDGERVEYPFQFSLAPEKDVFASNEPVALTFTARNFSRWPATLRSMPPSVSISSQSENRRVAVIPHGAETAEVPPGESVQFAVEYDPADHSDGGLSPGEYRARPFVQVLNTSGGSSAKPSFRIRETEE